MDFLIFAPHHTARRWAMTDAMLEAEEGNHRTMFKGHSLRQLIEPLGNPFLVGKDEALAFITRGAFRQHHNYTRRTIIEAHDDAPRALVLLKNQRHAAIGEI